MSLDDAARTLVAPYVSSAGADVFALVGLPEEDVAALFAHAADSAMPIRAVLAKLLANESLEARDFRAQAIAGPDAREHAVLHLAAESISLLAAKLCEDARLVSFTSRSLRAAPIDVTMIAPLPELGPLEATYRASAERLLATYVDLLPKTAAALTSRLPQGIEPRAAASDILRGLLPAGLRTQIAVTANARALGALLEKLGSHPLGEARRLGESMRAAAEFVAPGLFATAPPSHHRSTLAHEIEEALRFVYTPPPENATATMVVHQPVRILRWDKDALERIALALTYEGSDPRAHAAGIVDGLRQASASELEQIVRAGTKLRGASDPAPRGFEATSVTVELMTDAATYLELQRHHHVTPSSQRLTCRLGFDAPALLADLGGYETYADAMMSARDAWAKIEAQFPLESQYAVPLGYRCRALWTLDLRELVHVIERRSSRMAHPSERRMAQGLYRSITAAMPWLKEVIRVDFEPSPLGF